MAPGERDDGDGRGFDRERGERDDQREHPGSGGRDRRRGFVQRGGGELHQHPERAGGGAGQQLHDGAWVSLTSAGRETLFSFGDQLTTPEVEFNSAATGQWGAIITGTYETLTSPQVMQSDATLHHIVYTKNGAGATHALYLDGVAQSLSTNNPVTYVNATNPLWIGKRGAATQPWGGVVDELRISTTVRTAAWIATEYANQKTPASFLFAGPQQVHP